MVGTPAERGLDHGSAHLHFGPRRPLRHFRQHHMIDGMGPDGDQRIGRKLSQFVPGHAQLVAERRDLYLITSSKVTHDVAELLLGSEAAHPTIELLEQVALLRDAAALEPLLLAVDQQLHALVARDHRLEREPPQLTEPIGKAGWDIDRERRPMFLEDGIGEAQCVAVAIVDGDADEMST